MSHRTLSSLLVVPALLAGAGTASAQTFGSDFQGDYNWTDLGLVPGVPTRLGGIQFKPGDLNTLLIGGSANAPAGAIYEIGLARDAENHVTGFVGQATLYASAPYIDGSIEFAPNGVLFFTAYPVNQIGQIKPGSTAPDKLVDMTSLGVDPSVGALKFVPSSFDGAGRFKIASYNWSTWFDADLTPDGAGTFDIVNVTKTADVTGGPEGIVYIDGSNPGFGNDSVLIAEWAAGNVGAYAIDGNGDPMLASRRDFLIGLTGAEGALIDPLTGDFLFSTFGGGDRMIVVTGFTAPHIYCAGKTNSLGCMPHVTWSGEPTLSMPDDFSVSVTEVANNTFGVMMWGLAPANTPFGGGTLCIDKPAIQMPVEHSGGNLGHATDCSGTYLRGVTHAFMTGHGLTAGTSVYVQYLSRDPGFGEPENISLSEALTFVIRP